MSSTSGCPPQLHLSIPPSTTSFKRSFEQFGFDLDSPTSGGEPGSSSRASTRDRSKRARSASSLSDAASGESAETSGASADAEPAAPRAFLAPPRLPTPVIQDIDMPDYDDTAGPDRLQARLARFSEFDSNISALRSRSRSRTPPPVLPPLSLPDDSAIQVPDISGPASFNYRDLLGTATHLQHPSSSTQSQASSSEADMDLQLPDVEPAAFDIRSFLRESIPSADTHTSPRLEALRPSSPLFDLSPRQYPQDRAHRQATAAMQNDIHSWFETPPRDQVDDRFAALPPLPRIPISTTRDRPDFDSSDWFRRARSQSGRSYSPTPVASYRRISTRSQGPRFGSSNSLMAENAAELDRLSSHAELIDRLEQEAIDNEFALDSEDEEMAPLPRMPYERESLTESTMERAAHRRASFAFARGAQSRESSLARHLSLHPPRNDNTLSAGPSHAHHAHSTSYEPYERLAQSVDFFDSRTSTISDMARTIARYGRPEPTRINSFHGPISRPSATPPVIPAPDLGPGAIFIPHELEGPMRHAEQSRERPSFPIHQRSHTPPSVLPSSSSGIDPEAYAPGPFRNTMMWQAEMRQRHVDAHARPPTLPPLAFEERDSLDARPSGSMLRNRERSAERTYLDTRSLVQARIRAAQEQQDRAQFDHEQQMRRRELSQSRSTNTSTRFPFTQDDEGNPSTRQSSADIHSFLSRHVRSEVPRVEDDDVAGFARTLGAISRDRISRLHEHQREARTATAAHNMSEDWGRLQDLEDWDRDRERERYREFYTATLDVADDGRLSGSDGRRYTGPSRYGTAMPRRRPSPQRGASSAGGRPMSRFPRHSERSRPLYLDNPDLFLGSFPRFRRRFGGVIGIGLGDFMRDEDFDDSYESLITLGSMLGEAVPKATPAEVVSKLKTGEFQEWQTKEGDKRCPICLDDYAPTDTVTKLNDCPHWLHKECLEQWLKSASTCPVCRNPVKGAATSPASTSPPAAGPSSSSAAPAQAAPTTARRRIPRHPGHRFFASMREPGPGPAPNPGGRREPQTPEEADEEFQHAFGRRYYF